MNRDTGKQLLHTSMPKSQETVETERDTRTPNTARSRTDKVAGSARSLRSRGRSFLWSDDSVSGSYEGPVPIREILLKRKSTGAKEEGVLKYRRDYSQNTPYNSRKFGVLMLTLGVINFIMLSILLSKRGSYTECTVPIPDKSSSSEKEWIYEFTQKDCKGDLENFKRTNKIYVYYNINGYPYHAAAGYKLMSKKQIAGKKVNKKDLKVCTPYIYVNASVKEKLLYPCGIHLWHIYNDKFRFSSTDPNVGATYIKMDESRETLSQFQDFSNAKNPSKETIQTTKKNVYYWLLERESNITKNSSNAECTEKCDDAHITGKRVKTIEAIYNMMNVKESGEGLENGHVIQWMTPTPFKSFRKLYGVLDGPIELPFYAIVNIAYDTSKFGGSKSLSIVALTSMFGNVVSLQSALGILSALCIIISIPLLFARPGNPKSCFNLL